MTDDKKLKQLLLDAIDVHKAFGYAEAYQDDPRFITIDGELWSVTVPYPDRDKYRDEYSGGDIIIKKLGDCL